MPATPKIFASSSVVTLTTACIAIALFAFWLFLNREKAEQPVAAGDIDSLDGKLNEASTEFDLPDFPDFLRRVAQRISAGFGEQQVSRLSSMAEQLPHEREAQFEFQVVFEGMATPLQVRLFKDDISSIAVYFFTSKPLMEFLDHEMETFFEERGM